MSTPEININEAPDKILRKLQNALRADGDFPVRARVIAELREKANNSYTPVHQITDIILREPSLGTRVLHLVNSAFYHRSRPIMTITQAVIQVGMHSLTELCAGMILMQRFVPVAKRGGIFADNLKRSILAALVASHLTRFREEDGMGERGYLASTFYNLGHLLLAYYFPQVYEAAAKRAQTRSHAVAQSVTEILGIDPLELNLLIVDALEIPQYYRDILIEAYQPFADRSKSGPNSTLADTIATADRVACAVLNNESITQLNVALKELSQVSIYKLSQLTEIVEQLPEHFREHCSFVEMDFLSLPEYVKDYGQEEEEETGDTTTSELEDSKSQLAHYIEEIRQEIYNRQPISSVITAVMETLVFGIGYEQVILLLVDSGRKALHGKMSLGNEGIADPKQIRRDLDRSLIDRAPDITAYFRAAICTTGEPLQTNAPHFAAIPIGVGRGPVGILYAQSSQSPFPDQGVDVGHNLAIFAELLDQALILNS